MRRTYLLSVVVLVIGACNGDTTEPEPEPFNVGFADTTRSIEVLADSVHCQYTISAMAQGGESGAYALWEDSEYEWVDPNGPRYSYELTATDVLDYFGADRIKSGETLDARRVAWWDRPFQLHYIFRYRMPDQSLRSDDVWVNCTGS